MSRTVFTQPTAHWPDRVRLPFDFDARRLAADLAALEADEWIGHFVQQNYEGDWSVIPLRASAGATHPVMMIYSDPSATAFVDTLFLDRMPAVRDVLAHFRCPLSAARLMRLTPGSRIKEHADADLGAELGWARIHIPVTTSPAVEFLLNGTRVDMPAGSAWYLRLSDPHAVVNRGDADRVHLVIDMQVDDWLVAQLDAGVAGIS